MAGYRSVLIVVKFAVIATGAVTTIKAQRDIVTGMGTAADLLGSAQTVADDDDDEIKYIDIEDPGEKFVRVVVVKDASNSTAESAIAILYNRRKAPVTQPTGTEGERLSAVTEGTA